MEKPKILTLKLKVLLLFLVVILIGLIIFSNIQLNKFQVTNINPSLSQIYVITPSLEISFNQNIKSISINSKQTFISSYKTNKNILTLYFSLPLNSKEQYSINIIRVVSNKHQIINNLIYNFKPIYQVNNLPPAQKQQILNGQTQYNKQNNIAQLEQILPFINNLGDYEINYQNNNGAITVTITAPNKTDQQYAISYLQAEGINLSYFKIQYINAVPK